MATILASQLMDRAELILQDSTNIRWGRTELLGWLNDGQRAICEVRIDAYTKTSVVTLASGTKQALPSDGHALISVLRNMGTDGATPGKAVRKVPQALLDAATPDWHSATSNAVTLHYAYDPMSPRQFFVYPPAPGNSEVEIVYAASPPDVAAEGSAITLDDIYSNALVDYILYRAYSKDFELSGNDSRAAGHYDKFRTALGAKSAADAAALARDQIKG